MSPTAFNAPHSKSDSRGLFIGLMSGTSADGIEASMVSISKSRSKKFPAYRIELIAHRSFPFSEGLRARILGASESPAAGRPRAGQSTAALTSLHYDLGERFAAAAIGVAESAGIPLQKVSAIGSHGQTVCHRPLFGGKVIDATFQIGEPAVIAERTGIMVVGDFRPADVAAGGLGAPLTPYAHGTLFSARDHPVLVVNLGGICNVTWAPAGFSGGRTKALDGLEGFDTGPANMLLDAAVLKYSRGGEGHDRDGGMAARGQVDEKLLCHLIAHPFIRRRPPKATGREDFGARALKEAVEVFLRQRELRAMRFGSRTFCDFLATLSAFTTRSIGKQVKRFLPPPGEVVVCGGGARNPVLIDGLRREFPDAEVVRSEDRGIPAHAVEAVSFALLARAALLGVPANVPSITGARRPAVLGKIVSPA